VVDGDNQRVQVDIPYVDEDSTDEVHFTFRNNTPTTRTFDITILGIMAK